MIKSSKKPILHTNKGSLQKKKIGKGWAFGPTRECSPNLSVKGKNADLTKAHT